MYAIVRLTTSLPRTEVDRIDKLERHVTGNLVTRRAGILRALLRYALAHEDQFIEWLNETDGKPVEGGE